MQPEELFNTTGLGSIP